MRAQRNLGFHLEPVFFAVSRWLILHKPLAEGTLASVRGVQSQNFRDPMEGYRGTVPLAARLKQFPAYLNRWDSQQYLKGPRADEHGR